MRLPALHHALIINNVIKQEIDLLEAESRTSGSVRWPEHVVFVSFKKFLPKQKLAGELQLMEADQASIISKQYALISSETVNIFNGMLPFGGRLKKWQRSSVGKLYT